MDILQQFNNWFETVKDEITHVTGILSESLSTEPEKLIADLEAVEVWGHRFGALLAMSNSWLDKAKFFLMPSREEGKTEGDRKAEIDSTISPIRVVRDTLESVNDAIKTRISLGQSILKYYSQTAEHKGNIEQKGMGKVYNLR